MIRPRFQLRLTSEAAIECQVSLCASLLVSPLARCIGASSAFPSPASANLKVGTRIEMPFGAMCLDLVNSSGETPAYVFALCYFFEVRRVDAAPIATEV